MLATAPKARPCEYAPCGRPFIPQRISQKVCGQVCAGRKAKADRIKEKAEEKASDRARKEKIKRIPDLIREAQVIFNRWVRARDHDQPCISCGAPPPDLSMLHAGRDAGHYRSTGSASHLRFHPDNCHAQCVRCNRFGAGRAVDYRIRLITRIGAEKVEALEADNRTHKWQRGELIATRAEYKAKLKKLKEQQA